MRLRICMAVSAFATLALLLLPGCTTFRDEPTEAVTIDSYPGGAVVLNAGQVLGRTPMTVTLSKKKSHQFVLRLKHFKDTPVSVAPEVNEDGRAYLRFGLLEAAGHYHTLSPNPLMVYLEPQLIPEGRGSDVYRELAQRVTAADELLASGEINLAEHAYIIQCLSDHYRRKQ